MIAADYADYRELARRRLPRFLFEYIDGGSYAETTLQRNVEDMRALSLRQRVMHDVSTIDLSTTLFGRSLSMPVVLGPVGLAGLYARRGEVQAARAAEAAGVGMTLSTMSCCAMEEVRRSVADPFWLQLYMIRDRGFMADLLGRAAGAGVTTLILTVDLPVHSLRYRDLRTGLTGPQDTGARLSRMLDVAMHPRWAWDVGVHGRPHILGNVASAMREGAGLSEFTAWVGRNFDPSITWKDLDWIREHWSGAVVAKGVLDPADAVAAVKAGVDGLVVSNHGGRQLDGATSSIRALPQVVDAVGPDVPVLMDGGVRSGLDVLRALALGADGVLLGRAWAFALAAAGEAGVSRLLTGVRHELEVAMALTGTTDVKALKADRQAGPASVLLPD